MDQIFTIEMLVEEYLENNEKLYAAFMSLKKHMIGLVVKVSKCSEDL